MKKFNINNFLKLSMIILFMAVLQLTAIALSLYIFNNYIVGLFVLATSLIIGLFGGYINDKN